MDEEEPLQAKAENKTGLPDNLKSGIEATSGFSMDAVRVHYNSAKPAQLQALAYTQGTDIHVSPGQEKHLPHEAWHVVQQMQGRVQPTMQLQGVNVNDNEGLEREADVMGGKVLQQKHNNENNGIREVTIDQLPENDACEHIANSFKKGRMNNPIIDQTGKIVQMVPKKESFSGGDLFTVLKSDLGTGSDTTEETRKHVNDPATKKPNKILLKYRTNNNTSEASKALKKDANAYNFDNPKADSSYKSGKYWDAGHKLAKQNGGLGNLKEWVFPQNPAYNQGNSMHMKTTHLEWRKHENNFKEGVYKDGAGAWWIKLE